MEIDLWKGPDYVIHRDLLSRTQVAMLRGRAKCRTRPRWNDLESCGGVMVAY